jgi:hypothetical protein
MNFVYYGLKFRIFVGVGGLQLLGRKSRGKLSTLFLIFSRWQIVNYLPTKSQVALSN